MSEGYSPLQPVRPQDAFFRYVESPRVPQQVGAVIVADGDGTNEPGLRLSAIRADWAARLPALPMLHRTLVTRRWFQRPAWRTEARIDLDRHVTECFMTRPGDAAEWAAVTDAFFAEPLPLDRPPWQLQLVHGGGAGTGSTVVLAKMHHALGDGFAVLGSLIGLLADEDVARLPERAATPASPSWKRRRQHARKVVTGLLSLARAGSAPALARTELRQPGRQRYAWVELTTAKVQHVARSHRVSTSTLLIAVAAEAVHRALGNRAPNRLRALVPKTTRGALPPSGSSGAPGNWSAALQLDLPTGPMPAAERVAEVARRIKALERTGQPAGAQVAMAAFGKLPAPLHAWVLRLLYGRRFFNLIISVLPGPRQVPHLAGSPVRSVFPLVPLADGVGIGICALRWCDMIGVGITTDTALVADHAEFAALLRGAFDDM